MHKKNIFLIFSFTLILSLNILSQEVNPAFLESLPADMQQDLLERNKTKLQEEEKMYRGSQNSSKVFKENEENEQDIDDIFGNNFFRTFQSSFMPINEPNLDNSYLLGFGDMLEIQLVGSVETTDSYTINREGSINLTDVGKLYLSGKTLEEASSIIRQKVDEIYIGTKAYISLTNIRDISVLIAGNAFKPGVYTLSGNSNMLHAISIAGGISKFGSYRKIKLIRNNETIETLDVYELLVDGKYTIKERLRSGDLIFVEKRKNVIQIQGAVKRPGFYELLENQNLTDVLKYANGFNNFFDDKNMYLKRLANGVINEIKIPNLAQFERIKVKDGDMLFIRPHNFRKVTISGAVLNPSTYLMPETATLHDVIDKAGGYTKNAYPYGAVYLNDEAKETGLLANEILYNKFLDNVLKTIEGSVSNNLDLEVLLSLADNIRDAEPTGRISIDLTGDREDNSYIVKSGDSLLIPEKTNNIYIYGEVNQSGVYSHKNFAKLQDYIEIAGGFKEFADKGAIYILLPNGDTKSSFISKNIFANQPVGFDIPPGSIIFIPRKINNSGNRALAAQAYATILGQIGVSIASLAVLKD